MSNDIISIIGFSNRYMGLSLGEIPYGMSFPKGFAKVMLCYLLHPRSLKSPRKMVVGRRSFPIGSRKLFKGDVLNFRGVPFTLLPDPNKKNNEFLGMLAKNMSIIERIGPPVIYF